MVREQKCWTVNNSNKQDFNPQKKEWSMIHNQAECTEQICLHQKRLGVHLPKWQ